MGAHSCKEPPTVRQRNAEQPVWPGNRRFNLARAADKRIGRLTSLRSPETLRRAEGRKSSDPRCTWLPQNHPRFANATLHSRFGQATGGSISHGPSTNESGDLRRSARRRYYGERKDVSPPIHGCTWLPKNRPRFANATLHSQFGLATGGSISHGSPTNKSGDLRRSARRGWYDSSAGEIQFRNRCGPDDEWEFLIDRITDASEYRCVIR
jgi:hypothetical protein